MQALEATFGAPVLEAYGMTEAVYQMTSNPLPPRPRKAGSVGVATGPEIAIMDANGALLAPGQTGEVVIRGANVTPGYEANPAANLSAFTDGWFRTGDQGWLDGDGYLTLTGRLKELINRGGEKISPREVDEALLTHPAVRQALAFAIPHAQLGEDVGAAVELREGAAATPEELREWTGRTLPAFKVPRLIRVVDTIPKGPTGKLQRIGLAAKLGVETLDDTVLGEFVAPRTELEERIAAIWREMLPGARAGVRDRFEALGGDSLLAVNMLTAVAAMSGAAIPFQKFVEEGTIASLAREIESHVAEDHGPLTVLRREGANRPLVCVPGHDGSLFGFARMAASMGDAGPVWAFDFERAAPAQTIRALARDFVEHLRRRQPAGPYRLAGICFGGCVALEMAHLLRDSGEPVELLALIDTLNPAWRRRQKFGAVTAARARQLSRKLHYHAQRLHAMSFAESIRYLAGRLGAFAFNYRELAAARAGLGGLGHAAYRRLMLIHTPSEWPLDALIIRVAGSRLDAPALGWNGVIKGSVEIVDLPFLPEGALSGENAPRVAAAMQHALNRLGASR
jgi:thioesterase domain-containing protein